jgi:glycosyltransferase involved in cell wall biosynthesis
MSRLARAEKMEERIKICRIVTRLNVGGPARQAIFLSRALNGDRYDTCLVTGVPESGEGDMGYLATQHGVQRYVVPELRRSLHPWRDVRVFWKVWRFLRREQPLILHTHTAKAGALGRCAGWLYNLAGRMQRRRRPRLVMVHTFHGHVLAGYFGTVTTKLFTWIERQLARVTDRIVVVSEAAKQDLVVRRIGQPERITVIPLGFDLRALLEA